ncbi:unnamed protein product, partial [Tenebrio molitor]
MDKLLKEYKLTAIGTTRKNKREVPVEFTKGKNRPIHSNMFGFQKDATFVSYIPKKGKNVLLLSTRHSDDKIDGETGKPDIIVLYNQTKGGVDVLDKLCASYNCTRPTRRWPMVIFYSTMNIPAINSLVIYGANNPNENIIRRQLFQEALGRALLHDNLQRRAVNPHIPRTTRLLATRFAGIEEMARGNPSPNRRGRCKYRPKRKTRFYCCFCRDWLCMEH